MSDAKESWDNVGSKASSLGQKLKLHFEQARTSPPPGDATAQQAAGEQAGAGATGGGAAPGAAPGGEETKESKDIKDAFHRLADAIDDAFGAVGKAAKDPAVKDDVKAVGQALIDALGTTFSQVGGEVRKVVHRKGDEGAATAGGPDEPTPPTGSAPPPPPPTGSAPPPPPPTEAGEPGAPQA